MVKFQIFFFQKNHTPFGSVRLISSFGSFKIALTLSISLNKHAYNNGVI